MATQAKVSKEEALKYHLGGKIQITSDKPFKSQRDLSMAYSPGVAHPCVEIEKDNSLAYKYTNKSNLVAVISNGTAVLGLGNIGAQASKPVMEGKCILFKKFAGVNAYDIEINETDIDKFVDICVALSPTFGGINLEDIKAPECFEIERKLKEKTNIPVMHDDQHGTAIISSAALLNAIELANKNIEDLKVVVIGAGAAGVACARLYKALGVKHILMLDSKGVINHKRTNLDKTKQEFVIETNDDTLEDALKDADMVLGLSVAGTITKEMVKSMNKDPLLFTLANPDPEIFPEEVKEVRDDAIIGTGRSDYPNQINNVLGFPFIFRGALDVRSTHITENMKIAAVHALKDLAKEPVPEEIKVMYGDANMAFGKEYVIPTPFDKRAFVWVSSAVAEAAVKDGVAQIENFDINEYKKHLASIEL